MPKGDEITARLRRAEIAALMANPVTEIPTKEELAAQFQVDVRTIYRDMNSEEVQEAVTEIIKLHMQSEGLREAFKVILKSIHGDYFDEGITRKQQVDYAFKLIELMNIFAVPTEVQANELFGQPMGGLSKVPREAGDNPETGPTGSDI